LRNKGELISVFDKTTNKWLKFIGERNNPKTPEINRAILKQKLKNANAKPLIPFDDD